VTPDEYFEKDVDRLAVLFSERRTHGSVFMDGSHNPTPGELIAARRFMQDLVKVGWRP